MKEVKSEVQQLLSSIDLQLEAARLALHGTAIVASHDFILARTHGDLAQLVGNEQASKLIFERYTGMLEKEAPSDTGQSTGTST